jgi:hypothetical protein
MIDTKWTDDELEEYFQKELIYLGWLISENARLDQNSEIAKYILTNDNF